MKTLRARFTRVIALGALVACMAAGSAFADAPASQPPDSASAALALKDREIGLLRKRLGVAEGRLREESIARIVYQTQLEDAALHDLKVGEPLAFAPLTKDVLERIYGDSIVKQYPGRAFELDNWVMRFFGALPENLNVKATVKALMDEQAAGLYDPFSKKLYVSPAFDVSSQFGRMVLAHEIGHALQDQNFGLGRMGVMDADDSDRSAALMALIEGDATLLMGEHLAREGSPLAMLGELPKLAMMDQQKLETAPAAIRDSLLFPYLQGVAFLQALGGRTRQHPDASPDRMLEPSWRNDLFLAPPISTEQILHPEKYLANEKPASIAPPATGADDGPYVARDTLGEFGIRMALEATLDADRAAQAAAGWNGDRLLVTEDAAGHRRTLHWVTRWDSPRDAEEFASALADALAKRFGKAGLAWAKVGSGQAADARRAEFGDGNRFQLRRPAPDAVTLDVTTTLAPRNPATGEGSE
jgi:hypothetical protein